MRLLIAVLISAAGLSAATCTSVADGNWSAQTTWGASGTGCSGAASGGIPGIGDTVTINSAVTVDVNTTVGHSPAASDATSAILIGTGGSLTINTNITLNVRGDFKYANPSSARDILYWNPGSVFYFDPSAAADRTTARYLLGPSSDTRPNATLKARGSSINYAKIATYRPNGDEAYGRIDNNGFVTSVNNNDFQYLLMEDLGESATFPAMEIAGTKHIFDHVTVNRCGPIYQKANMTAGGTYQYLDMAFTNSRGTYNMNTTGTAAMTTGVRELKRVYFDKAFGDSSGSASSVKDFTIDNVIFSNGFTLAPGSPHASLTNSVLHASSGERVTYGGLDGVYIISEDATNPHQLQIGAASSNLTFQNVIFQVAVVDDAGGDGFIANSDATHTHTIQNCLVLPRSDGTGPSNTLLSFASIATPPTFKLYHNTIMGSKNFNHGVFFAEGGITPVGAMAEYKSNLYWDTAVETSVVEPPAGAGANHFTYQNGTVNDNMADPAQVTNNNAWNFTAANQPGKTSNGTPYSIPMTGTVPGTGDTNVDPQFVDTSRNFETWGQTQYGADGTVAGTLAVLQADPTRIAGLISWVQAGFAPTNAALATAGHDGGTIGAVAAVLPPTFPFTDSFPTDGAVSSDWSVINGAWSISGGKLVQTESNTGGVQTAKIITVSTIAPSADMYVQSKLWKDSTDSASTSLVSRYNNSAGTVTFYLGMVRNIAAGTDQWAIYRYSGTLSTGTFTQVGSTTTEEFTDGSLVRFITYGSSLSLQLWNGSAWVTKVSGTDSTYTSAGYVGLRANYNGGSSFDDFGAGVYVPTATMSKFPGAHVNGSFVY